ncbi:MAG: ABC transporter ATP-binding protein [Acetobacteraceae bacterium]
MMVATVWRLLDGRQKHRLVALQLLSVLMALATVSGIAAILPFFTVLADPGAAGRNPVLHALQQHLHLGARREGVAFGLAFMGLVAIANAVNLAGSLLMNRFAFEVGHAFNTALFEEYLARDYAFHLRSHGATLASRLLHETRRITTGVLQGGLLVTTNLVTAALIVCSMVLIDPPIALIALTALGATYAAIYAVVRGRLLRNGVEESARYAERTGIVGEALGAIKEILLLKAQAVFAERFAVSSREISRSMVSTLTISQSPRHALEIATAGALVGCALYLRGGNGKDGVWIATLSFMGLAVYRLLPSLQQAFAALVRIRADRPALDGIAGDLEQARSRSRNVQLKPAVTAERDWPREAVCLEDVSFRYEPVGPDALAGVSLRIPAGAMVGLVGENGSGKTTLLDVLAGLLAPQSGRLVIDGIPIEAANLAGWHSALAYVPQEVFLLDDTLVANIAFGVPPGQRDPQRLQTAMRLARLTDGTAALGPCSGRLGERGNRLSGGQRQRVGLARALYRDASVLLLDEATSELDAASQEGLVEALQALRAERTVILTGHRLSTLRYCDVIYELAGGRIVRSLTYEQLQVRRSGGPQVTRQPGRAGRGAS